MEFNCELLLIQLVCNGFVRIMVVVNCNDKIFVFKQLKYLIIVEIFRKFIVNYSYGFVINVRFEYIKE